MANIRLIKSSPLEFCLEALSVPMRFSNRFHHTTTAATPADALCCRQIIEVEDDSYADYCAERSTRPHASYHAKGNFIEA